MRKRDQWELMLEKAEQVDLWFIDFMGTPQHFTIPQEDFDDSILGAGIGFDGSSIAGYQPINASDMVLIPDTNTAFMDPFSKYPTVAFLSTVFDPGRGVLTRYSRDPRYIARKAERYLDSTGIADMAYFGPEAECYIFNSARYERALHRGFYHIDSAEAPWNTGKKGENLGHKQRLKQGYFPRSPLDQLHDLRSEMMRVLRDGEINAECHHHEVGAAGQIEIDIKYAPLLTQADKLMRFKDIVKNVAFRNGLTATFMPKPIVGDNGSGMHVHQSLWKNGENIFYDSRGYALLSPTALHYIGGLLKHGPALMAFCAPHVNSYRRLVPGFEAPVNLVYSQRNRSAAVRVPMYSQNPKTKRVEFRPPDPTANPYLTFAAMLMAGLDGIKNKIDPGAPHDEDVYESAKHDSSIPTVPGSLKDALDALAADHGFLLEGDVFTPDAIEMWLDLGYKRHQEWAVNGISVVEFEHSYSS